LENLAEILKEGMKDLDLVFKKSQKDIAEGKFNYHYEECIFDTSNYPEPV